MEGFGAEVSYNYPSVFDDIANQYKIITETAGGIILLVPAGTYADISAVRTALAGTVIQYELATPVTTDITDTLEGGGVLQSWENGTMYLESVLVEEVTASGTTLTLSKGISEMISVSYIDSNGAVVYEDLDDLTLASSTSITGVTVSGGVYQVKGYLTYNINGEFTGEADITDGAKLDNAIKMINQLAKQNQSMQDKLNLLADQI